MIERKYHEWIQNDKSKDPQYCQIMLDPEYVLDLFFMIQIYAYDRSK